MELVKWYESKENLETLASDCLARFTALDLQYQSKGGMHEFLTTFEQLLLDLEQANAPLQDAQKKPSLLERIKDKSYQSIVEILKHDSNADFKTCTRELAMHANKVEQGRNKDASELRIQQLVEMAPNRRPRQRRMRMPILAKPLSHIPFSRSGLKVVKPNTKSA